MPGPSTSTWLAAGLLARLGLAGIFLTSGVLKAIDPVQTRLAVRAYQLLSPTWSDAAASVLPYFEIGLGLLLLLGLATRLAAALAAVMMLVFVGGVISVAARGLSIDCGCFGGGGPVAADETAYTAEILRDSGFFLLATYLVWRPASWLSMDRWVHGRAGSEDAARDESESTLTQSSTRPGIVDGDAALEPPAGRLSEQQRTASGQAESRP